jgi:hypothetical protein
MATHSFTRRDFLAASAAACLAGPVSLRAVQPPRKKLAVITTVWRNRSHAWHMAERFLVGYPKEGKWYKPPLDVVSAYVDQQPDGDLSKKRSEEFKFPLYKSIAEALRCGGQVLAVDAVLIIGEHGSYEKSEFGQTKYPRYEFFKQVSQVFREEKKSLPVFNDKHLSWNWDWAREMYDTARELKIPFCAGSSLPVTWRMPAIDMPYDAPVEEMMCVAFGGVDSYDFHALEVIQCMAERRRGGETGVSAVQGLRGEAVWKAFAAAEEKNSWKNGGFDPRLFEACLARCQTLAQVDNNSHRYPTPEQIRAFVKDPVAYRIEYRDGTRATMLLLNGLVTDFTFAARLKDQAEPLSTLFYLPPTPNVTYSAGLMAQAEATFLTGKSPSPLERTLLTTGLVEAGVRSLGKDQQRLETPHLAIAYQAPRESQFLRT